MVMVGVKAQIMDPGFNIMVVNFNLLPCNISWQIYADYLEEQGNFTCYAYRYGFYCIENNNDDIDNTNEGDGFGDGGHGDGCGDGNGGGIGGGYGNGGWVDSSGGW